MKKYCRNRSIIHRVLSFVALLTTLSIGAQPILEPYTFTTVAGGGGFSTTEQAGIAPRLSANALALDSVGNLYLADTGNHVIRKITVEGAIITLAGLSGTGGSADGRGSEARFLFPDKMIVDASGNLYISDAGNCTLRKLTPDGMVTTLAGQAGAIASADGIGNSARFNAPAGLAMDSAGNIYLADQGNSTIRKVSPAGSDWVVSTIAGRAQQPGATDGIGTAARFNFPQALAIDPSGNLYVGDTDNFTIRKMTRVGTNWVVTTIAGRAGVSGSADGTNAAARFSTLKGLVLDPAGNLYVADESNHLVRKVTPLGTNWVVTTIAGKAKTPGSADGPGGDARFSFPYGLVADLIGNIYVADPGNGAIRKITVMGTNAAVTTVAGFGGNFGSNDGFGVDARFKAPFGIILDGTGNAYVTDQGNHTLRMISSEGVVTTLAGLAGHGGSANGKADAARFNGPAGVALDSKGNLYIADSANNTIRKAAWTGTNWNLTTFAGLAPEGGSADGSGSNARFWYPYGVSVDPADNIYVADFGNCTIRRITPAGTVTTVAGNAALQGEFAQSDDGVGSAAHFNSPSALTVDHATNIFIADTANHTIRKMTRNRVVTTLAGLAGAPGSADGIGKEARFNRPSGIVVDGLGNLFVTDGFNNTIRKLTPAGTNWVVTTLGGAPGIYGAQDGSGEIARFANPNGIALDGAGHIYIADLYFSTIRKGTPGIRILSSGEAFGVRAGQFGFGLSGSDGKSSIIDATTDFRNWQPIWTNSAGRINFRDSESSGISRRFYRLRVL